MQHEQSLLSVRDLVVRYPARGNSRVPLTAVRGVSLDIKAG
jgi:ABC-type glutathione transport system ATPase component